MVDANGKTRVIISSGEDGGRVRAIGKDGISGVMLGVDVDEGGGLVFVQGKGGTALLAVTEHGGRVHLQGKGEGKAAMGINEYGNGAVSTWDKNGYRQ